MEGRRRIRVFYPHNLYLLLGEAWTRSGTTSGRSRWSSGGRSQHRVPYPIVLVLRRYARQTRTGRRSGETLSHRPWAGGHTTISAIFHCQCRMVYARIPCRLSLKCAELDGRIRHPDREKYYGAVGAGVAVLVKGSNRSCRG